MGSHGSDQVMVSGCLEPDCSNATVEIKIKTLDSQTYTLQVDKCVPVPALKEQIASVTGVVSEQQRLICRGRVLKDDQLLSAYHVEDGHTLHLVVRQPIPPSSESLPDHPVTDPASSAGRSEGSRVSPSVVVETFNISEQGNGVTVFPGIGQIVSAVLNSFGTTNTGSGSEGVDLREPPLERLSRISNLIDLSNSSRRQPDQATARNQSNPLNVDSSRLQTATPLEPQQPPVIHDSLTTLSQYLSHLRHDFGANGGNSNSSEAAVAHGSNVQESDAASRVAAGQRGLPGPASLAEVMLSTRQLLIEQAADCLSHLARQLEDQANVTEPSTRMGFQTNALRSGALLQNLGASLLELGRTTMTLRLGQTPADAVVSAGPAVFISTSGPNPLMVQPLPFQLGTSFGAIPTSEPASGLSGGTLGSGFLPRNIDIRIRTGSLMPSVIVNQGEQNGAQPSLGQANSAVSGGENSIFQAAAGALGVPSSITESEVLVVPIRTVVAAVPAVRHTPSDTSHSSAGLLFPVLARVQRVTSGNMNSTRGSQSSSEHNPTGLDAAQQPITEAAGQHQNIGILGRDDNNHSGLGNQNGQGFLTELRSRLDQLFRNMFSVEEIHGGGDVNFQNTATNSGALHTGTTEVAVDMQEGGPRVGDEAADTQGEEPGVDDEGAFFSNLLRQTMPFMSQNRAMDSNSTSSGENTDNTQGEEPGVDDEGAFFSNLLRQTMPFISQNRAMDSNNMSSGGNTDNRQESSTHAPNPDVGTSSRQADPPSPPRAKRQKRE